MNDNDKMGIDELLAQVDELLGELDDIVERLEVCQAGLYSVIRINPGDLD